MRSLSKRFWSLVWNTSEYLNIGLGRFAPYVFHKMIGCDYGRVDKDEEK